MDIEEIKAKFQILQHLNLKKGELAACIAGYPNSILVIVKADKDIPNTTNVIDEPRKYFTIYGDLLTSHLISSNWHRISSLPKGIKIK